ncbi:hypothetical protein [Streptosporangium sp. NPDC087985]|uniref:hypothetical protein n=1 Tax=Streptosporangium sp. NPDC087985 TaxID=3366196 RepID=UPI003818BE41
MDVFTAVAEIRMAASRALARLHKQQIALTADRAEAIATGSALDDAALAKFMDENGGLP